MSEEYGFEKDAVEPMIREAVAQVLTEQIYDEAMVRRRAPP